MTLQQKLKRINDGIAGLSVPFYHYRRPRQEPPFGTWQEHGEGDSFYAGDLKVEQVIVGAIDYFTKVEFDPVVDEIQGLLDTMGVVWNLDSVQYEEETNLIHYEWSWEA